MFFVGGGSNIKDRYDLLIIGAGPGGMSAGIYATRAGLSTLIVEKSVPGGQMNETDIIDNYPGFYEITGSELSNNMRKHAESLGVEFHTAEVVKVVLKEDEKKIYLDSGHEIAGKVLIIATGASHKKLGVPGEEEFSARGVSYCATCDGHFFKDKVVAVIGGGNTAITEALFLSKLAKKVYVVHRRDKLRAVKALQEKAFNKENIEFIWNSVVVEIKGDSMVNELVLMNKQTGENFSLSVDGVFVSIGVRPNSEIFEGMVKMDESGFILTDENMETNVKGVYAVGDVRSKNLRQIVTAVAEGAIAASHAAEKYFE